MTDTSPDQADQKALEIVGKGETHWHEAHVWKPLRDRVAQALRDARQEERRWWLEKHIEIAAMEAPSAAAAIVCGKGASDDDFVQLGWAAACMAWAQAVKELPPAPK
jgi:hypothetical protein